MLDLRQLKALRAVAEHGSVLRAAAALQWSQPTVTHHLRGIGRVLDAEVVAAGPEGTRLTAVGEAMLPHAIAILDRSDRAVEEIRSLIVSERRRIAIGVFPSAGARLLPQVVLTLQDAGFAPDVTEAELDPLMEAVIGLRLDAAIVYDAPGRPTILPPGFRMVPVRREHLSVIVPADHPLAGRPGVHLADLAEESWVAGAAESDPVDAALAKAAERAGFTPRIAIRSDDYAVVAAYVAAGFGAALVPELALPTHLDTVAALPVEDSTLERRIFLVTSPSVGLAARTALEASLRAVADEGVA
ncbi:HTH-type transcriptional regulator GltC [Microbacterium hydrocarbonoxydans]|uniref:HTH-type transcriptional regulator GltC n=1 Tax=Microbacterium hydrocarbonoxydans TaxID=273678 RepID=A0A0M2HSP6_9MICO|nr:LysR substrate-binding domain-containing protein [Microbacterium hydrocarbonoxydans]KJL47945.1 HTH-type transcriptional regulator GltC [Microbacterium hydrocarbonoxydans]